MTPRQRFMAALTMRETDQVPFAEWVDDQIKAELTMAMGEKKMNDAQFAKNIGFDAIDYQGFFYLCPIGVVKKYDSNGNREYYTSEGLIECIADLDKLKFANPHDAKIYDDAKKFVDQYGNEDLALYAGLRPGIAATIYGLGWMGFADALYHNVKLIETMLERYMEWNAVVAEKLQDIGFDFLITYDNIAYKSGPMFSPQMLREIFLPRFKKLTESFRIPWAYHSDGDLTIIMDDLLELGMNCIHPIDPTAMEIKTIKRKYGDRVCLWGNIDIAYTLSSGTPEETENEVKQRIQEIGPGGGFILGTANSITDFCKVENVLAMARAVKKYGKYPLLPA